MKKETPILLLTGYLGSGKTTLVNHILNNGEGIKFAVIVNDIGEVNIDARLIQQGGVVASKDDSLVALQNGCICCSLKMDLVKQLDDIQALHKFDYIVIEASGICEPAPIASTICSIPTMGDMVTRHGVPRLDCIVTVVDALRMATEFGCGDTLKLHQAEEEDIESLVIQQIEFCNIIVLNKVSEVSEEQRLHIREIVKALQPHAEIIETDYADIDLKRILNTGLFDIMRVSASAGWIGALETPLSELEEHHHEHHHDDEEDEHHHHHEHDEHHEEHEDEHHHHEEDEHHHDEHDEHHHHGHHHHDHDHHHDHAAEYGISTFVYYRRRPFDLPAFDHFVATRWQPGIIRAKGICYFKSNTDMSYMFEQAGVQKKLSEAGLWYATASEEELMQYFKEEPGLLQDWDDNYGDRMQKIVFICQKIDKDKLIHDLDECLA